MKLCKCGCGQEVSKITNIYISGHNSKGMKRIFTKEHCQNISKSLIGRKLSPEHIKNSALGHIGIKFSIERRQNISEALKEGHRLGRINIIRKKKKRIKHNCEICNNEFFVIETRKKVRFCSYKCYWLWMKTDEYKKTFTPERNKKLSESLKGRKKGPITEEHRKNISKALIGRKPPKSAFKKGHQINKGKKKPEGFGKKVSERQLGKNNHFWQDGKSFEIYPQVFNNELKEQIRKRDNYRCQECQRHQDELFTKDKNGKIVNYKLNIHHIDYNKKNNIPDNLISLCRSCNSQANFGREDWTDYFKNKIKNINVV